METADWRAPSSACPGVLEFCALRDLRWIIRECAVACSQQQVTIVTYAYQCPAPSPKSWRVTVLLFLARFNARCRRTEVMTMSFLPALQFVGFGLREFVAFGTNLCAVLCIHRGNDLALAFFVVIFQNWRWYNVFSSGQHGTGKAVYRSRPSEPSRYRDLGQEA